MNAALTPTLEIIAPAVADGRLFDFGSSAESLHIDIRMAALFQLLRSGSGGARELAVYGLDQLTERLTLLFTAGARESVFALSDDVAETLAELRPDLLVNWLYWQRLADWDVARALLALASAPEPSRHWLPVLRPLLVHAKPYVREAAVHAITAVEPDRQVLAGLLRPFLAQEPTPEVRAALTSVLERSGG